MNPKPIRIGIVGAGANTRRMHIPKLQELEGVEIISICNRSRASSEKVAAQFNIPTVYDHWWELVAAADIEAVVIGTWPYMHCQMTLVALAAGKHVMVEARMAMDAAEAEQMVAASKARPQLVTQVVPAPLSFAVDTTIRRLLADGYLGELLAIEVRDHGRSFLDDQAPAHWRQNPALSGVNMLTLGIWYETIARWVGEATTVAAMGTSFVKMRLDRERGYLIPTPLPEHLTVLAEMACGAQATFSMSQVTGLRPVQEAVLYGRDGTLRFAGQMLYGGRRGESELQELEIPDQERGVWRVEEAFIRAIRGQEPIHLTTFEKGLQYMRFTSAVDRSLRERQMVYL
ncbi:MAG: Gfo/Idh/MocA family oxidoreductase [Ardenticatenaceae bacterium]|nr:Gfo/Idh/MocA family oxidoreductase [Ardenticatenaceae bacterium]